jgi:dGTP triphosphohydrolase
MIMLTEGLTWHYVIDSSMLVPVRAGQRQIVRELFLAMTAPLCVLPGPGDGARSPGAPARPEVAAHLRQVADTIASMTECQAMHHYALVEPEGMLPAGRDSRR